MLDASQLSLADAAKDSAHLPRLPCGLPCAECHSPRSSATCLSGPGRVTTSCPLPTWQVAPFVLLNSIPHHTLISSADIPCITCTRISVLLPQEPRKAHDDLIAGMKEDGHSRCFPCRFSPLALPLPHARRTGGGCATPMAPVSFLLHNIGYHKAWSYLLVLLVLLVHRPGPPAQASASLRPRDNTPIVCPPNPPNHPQPPPPKGDPTEPPAAVPALDAATTDGLADSEQQRRTEMKGV